MTNTAEILAQVQALAAERDAETARANALQTRIDEIESAAAPKRWRLSVPQQLPPRSLEGYPGTLLSLLATVNYAGEFIPVDDHAVDTLAQIKPADVTGHTLRVIEYVSGTTDILFAEDLTLSWGLVE